jgi:hypothetical protein
MLRRNGFQHESQQQTDALQQGSVPIDDLVRARKQYRWNEQSVRFSAAVERVQNPVFSSIALQDVAAQIAEKSL